jgi:TnpA family transposase
MTTTKGTLYKDLSLFMLVPRRIDPRMRNISHKKFYAKSESPFYVL